MPRSVIVTGASSGIGFACVRWFAEQGCQIVACDHDPVEESESYFAERGIASLRCDVRKESDVEKVVDAAVRRSNCLDVLVNSAGVGATGEITQIDEGTWDRCLDTNLKGAFLFCKHAIRAMKPRGGVIVNIASNAGILPRAHDPVYCVSKAGLVMLTKALALSHAKDRIRVNAVCPGPVEGTRMMDNDIAAALDPDAYRRSLVDASPMSSALGRMASANEIAESVAYLASDSAILVTGTLLAIDGGKSLGVPPKT
ncbi:MAG: SDR family oxidoreductase [Planctomycetota bacterium]